ncbi:PHP domain-containing protein [Sporolactobacillus laevolacticus]|uniref:PHP domain-containing protein n=1 Tax=Sporolactobacillus laevolacticus TaxID=33018 RepID=UPI0025B29EF8|nr:PHP domain-containing protein [Sporolactobacillus laevolacticus]MDN3955237.1 PHP domain-containing protein [Sporolactobacillus laevolacticus]
MPFDTHNHTHFSFDADMDIQDALKEAEKYNLNLVLTEHYDLNEQQEDGRPVDFEIDRYFETYSSFRGERLLLGIELGLDNRPDYITRNRTIAESHPFDMVIGSVHNLQDYDMYSDRTKNFLSKQDFFSQYLIYAENTIHQNPYIDTFAHIDYPCRYLTYSDNVLRYENFPLLIDNFLFTLIENDICLEINLRLIDQPSFREGLESIVRRYRELGGKYVTIGGDNHSPNTIGIKYPLGLAMAKEYQLTPVYFKNRKRIVDQLQ